MKRTLPPAEHTRFSGNLRHYHRGGARAPRSWDDWVEGISAKPLKPKKWPKIVGIIIGVLALSGIITGLIIELS